MRTSHKRLALLLTLVVLVTSGCKSSTPTGPGAPKPTAKPDGTPIANFTIADMRVLDPQDRSQAVSTADGQRKNLENFIDAYYTVAFLDPAKWVGGTHPELAFYFTEEAKAGEQANLGILALADLATRVNNVKPTKQEISKVTFFVDNDLSVPIGYATVAFEATATPNNGGQPVKIVQNAGFWLQKDGDSFKISAFSADINAQGGAAK